MHSLRTLFVAALLTVPCVAAGQGSDILTGRITGPDGRPLGDAQVEAVSVESEITRTVITAANGRYTMIFPDGGGRYLVRISYIGMTDILRVVAREGDEELLVTDFQLTPRAIELESIDVRAALPPPGRGQSGEQSLVLWQQLLSRMALPDMEPETLAQLAAGVIATESDSLTGRRRFSVGGMSDELNQLTLDGGVIGEGAGGFGAPEEGIRRTQVTTSSYDPARGGFAGGQVSLLSQRGNNRAAGSLSYRLDDAALQVRAQTNAPTATRHNLGGSYSGPIIQNKVFYAASFQLTRNINYRYALDANDPLAAQRSGVASDSIMRFLSIMDDRYGFPVLGQTGEYNQFSNDLRLQGRADWNIVQKPEHSQTLTARFNTNLNTQDSTRINALDVMHHGGDADRNTRVAGVTLTSRFRRDWTNTFNMSYSETWNESIPYYEMPEGTVRITSDFDDGTRGTRSVVFGGNRSMPTNAYNRDVQLTNELALLMPFANGQIHRIKAGGSLQRVRDVTRSTDNIFGSFTYYSLTDFEENRPDRYERSLSEREARTGRFLAGLYAGDTWRVIAPLELTFGLRWDFSRYDQQPQYNPAVDSVFGLRTDEMPVISAFSPRFGFNYRIGQAPRGGQAKTLSGGFGVFAGRAPTSIFSTALRQTGMPDGEQRLICIGEAVPIPDWQLYLDDPSAAPGVCADGGGATTIQSSRAPTVTVIAPNQKMPSSLRAEVNYRTSLPFQQNGSIRYTFSRGYGLWGYRDRNLNEDNWFMLDDEQRPFFGPETSIVTRTGTVSQAGSRNDPAFANVYEVLADRSSQSHQVSLQSGGRIRPSININLNYTLSFNRDNGSGSFTSVPVAGNPNLSEWSTASNDRRHTMNLTWTQAVRPSLEISATTRLSSGMPFTPIVNRDINGDGARNDRAFVFNPATVADTAVAAGMERLIAQLPGRVRDCVTAQFDRIASRNSCRDSWTQTLDMKANFRPSLPRLQRRMTMSLDARNVLTGLDLMLHGRDDLKGWGEGQRAEPILLNARGYSRTNNAFRYEVNEAFGQTRRGPNSSRSAFTVTLSSRLAIGGQPGQNNRGFGQTGNPGGGGGGGGGGGATANIYGPFTPLLRTANPTSNVDSVVAHAFTHPLDSIIEMRETLALTAEQTAAVTAIIDTLNAQHERRREAVRPVLAELVAARPPPRTPGQTPPGGQTGQTRPPGQTGQGQTGQGQTGQGQTGQGQTGQGQTGQGQTGAQTGQARPQGQGGQTGGSPTFRRYQADLQPHVEGARREITEALQMIQRELTEAQWQALPQSVRTAGTVRPPGGQGGQGGTPPRPPGGGGG